MIQIIPAVLSNNEAQYRETISRLNQVSALEDSWVHIDFADNIFVQNSTIAPEVIKKFPTNLHKEAHLMVAKPKNWIDKLAEARFERIIFHIESEDNIEEVIDLVKTKGLEVGLAINNETPIEKLEVFVDKIDVVLVMTIIPGFQGQPFIPEALKKVKEIKTKGWSVKIGVDGHVDNETARDIVKAGVDFICVGSYLLKDDIEENLENLWEIIHAS